MPVYSDPNQPSNNCGTVIGSDTMITRGVEPEKLTIKNNEVHTVTAFHGGFLDFGQIEVFEVDKDFKRIEPEVSQQEEPEAVSQVSETEFLQTDETPALPLPAENLESTSDSPPETPAENEVEPVENKVQENSAESTTPPVESDTKTNKPKRGPKPKGKQNVGN